MNPLTLNDLYTAAERIRPYVHETPIFTCETINHRVGANVFFKCENLQKCGAFKVRGATNAVFSLSRDEAERGVVTHSSGNHGAALARAARLRGIPANIVMPMNSAEVKKAAVEHYGGKITFSEPTEQSRIETVNQVLEATGGTMIHPYNDYRIIAGQSTVGLEILKQVPQVEMILSPVGGGGLLSGILLAVKQSHPNVQVIGCEPSAADDAYRSWKANEFVPLEKANTIADGLRTSLGDKTWPIIKEYIDAIHCVSEESIIAALRFMLERMKLVVEPSSAVPLAVLLERMIDVQRKNVVIVISGGNLDFTKLPF